MATTKKSYPVCFNSKRQYEAWEEGAEDSNPGDSRYCADCTVAYQRQMIAQHRCAHPCTSFYLDKEGFLEGRRRVEDRVRLKEAA